jgi:hypothetical protein
MDRLYYTAPSDEIFEEAKQAIKERMIDGGNPVSYVETLGF